MSISLAYCLCLAPHVYALVSYEQYLRSQPEQVKEKYPLERHQPRTFLASLEANGNVAKSYKERLQRAHAASLNGYENLGFFAAAVVAANVGYLAQRVTSVEELWKVNVLSLSYLASRAAFNLAYTLGVSGPHRGIYYYSGVGICMYLFSVAGKSVTTLATK